MQIEHFNACLPKRILCLINEKGFKQCSIAKKAGLKQNEFYAMLNNRKIIKPIDVIAIAKALNVDVDELFKSD